jgi:hypothetical protein
MFQLPALVLSVLIASIESVIFFIWQGKTVRAFAAYWVAGVLGFLLGQGLAIALNFSFLMLGQIHIVEGVVVCAIALVVVKLLKM